MAAKQKRKVEYKDTFSFLLFPQYEYTRAQRLRFLLFQGRIEHWRAAINYADAFDTLEQINLLYLIGYDPKIQSYVERNTRSNLFILCAPFTKDDLAIYDRYQDFIKQKRTLGMVDANGDISPAYHRDGQKWIDNRHVSDVVEAFAQKYEDELDLISQYEQLKVRSQEIFSRYIMISKGTKERTVSHDVLNRIVKQVYPYGWEQSGMDERTIKFPKKVTEALQLGLERTDTSRTLGLPDGIDSYTACRQAIRRCEMDINTAIRESGIVDLVKVFHKLQAPPYGWNNDAYTAYCFGYALSGHLDNTWIWDEVSCFPTREVISSILRNILRGSLGRRKSFILIAEDGKRLANRFAYIFGLGRGNPKDALDDRIMELSAQGLSERKIAAEIGTISNVAVHYRLAKMKVEKEIILPFGNLAGLLCQKIEQTTRWPIAVLDSQLRDTICGTFDDERHASVPIMTKGEIRTALDYFTWERCKDLKVKFETVNTYVPNLIRERYGDVNTEKICEHCTTTASGWVWSAETFWDCVDRYIHSTKEVANGTAQV